MLEPHARRVESRWPAACGRGAEQPSPDNFKESKRIAVVGAGVSGLVTAYLLQSDFEVTVFEANDYAGGHTRTIKVQRPDRELSVDTGFIVFNERNYPNFVKLLRRLDIDSQLSDMSFSVQSPGPELEYSSRSLNGLFAQRGNLYKPGFYRMLGDILRFYREAPRLLDSSEEEITLGEFLRLHEFSDEFVRYHIVPMGSAIWSSQGRDIQDFPVRQFAAFFANHDFLKVRNRSPWKVVSGGSARYVEALTRSFRDRIRLKTPVAHLRRSGRGVEIQLQTGDRLRFDAVVIAVHADQALRLLADPTPSESEVLSSFPYRANETILHTDPSLLPRRRRSWASWNYFIPERDGFGPTVTYYMNLLQSLPTSVPFCVSLNRSQQIDPSRIVNRNVFHHPQYSKASFAAQSRKEELNGRNRTFYCGAYWGYGFHEDGVKSALDVCRYFGKEL